MQFLNNSTTLLIVLLSLTSCIGAKKSQSDYAVVVIDANGDNFKTNDKTFILFPDSNVNPKNQKFSSFNFSGWNHTANGSETEWTNLKLPSNNYDFNSNGKQNTSANNIHTLDMVLVKKIADWNHQHANGFECNILAQNYKFGEIKNLVFDLKINSAKTNIPNIKSLKNTYASYVNDTIVDALDNGKVDIGITIGDNTNLNGSIIIQLDQGKWSEKWVRVIIPINKLTFYQEINYKRTSKTLDDISNLVINRILVVGETKSGSVLRGNINPWNSNVPEIFKEMDLSFKKIAFQLK